MGELKFDFNPEKAGQAAAFLLKRSGGTLTKGKLVKMLYASDWSHLRESGTPITGDKPVSMPHGPVLSGVLDLINGERVNDFWRKSISRAHQTNHHVKLLDADAPTDLLTESDKRALERVHDYFAPLEWEKVKSECYRIFKEWKNPVGSQTPIDFEDMLLKSGKKTPAFVSELVSIQREHETMKSLFA